MIIERFGGNVRQRSAIYANPVFRHRMWHSRMCIDNNRDAAETGLSRAENKAGFGQVTPVA